jgi:hypothetical protein
MFDDVDDCTVGVWVVLAKLVHRGSYLSEAFHDSLPFDDERTNVLELLRVKVEKTDMSITSRPEITHHRRWYQMLQEPIFSSGEVSSVMLSLLHLRRNPTEAPEMPE